jgi:type II secretory pathway component PulJ
MNQSRTMFTRRTVRTGATLIDVAVGSMLLAVLLIPSVRLISETQSSQQRLTNRDLMLYEAEQLLEATKVALSEVGTFNNAMARPIDNYATIVVPDGPQLVSRVRAEADRSLPTARLLTINVDIWIDANGNGRLDTGEASESLRTQWAAPQ